MSRKTESELAFEAFCESNDLVFDRIEEGAKPTPDYRLHLPSGPAFVEVKQIDEDAAFSSTHGSRTPGAHVRAKINDARNQVRAPASSGSPTILLIFNNLDPWQRFGTEPHDFLAGMYGDLTVSMSTRTGKMLGSSHGRNQALRVDKNTSFSAVGWLCRSPGESAVHVYENLYARVPLDYESLPTCISFSRVEITSSESA